LTRFCGHLSIGDFSPRRGSPHGTRTKPPYTLEFRSEAVRLARSSGRPPAQIARDLGCCTETLKSWMRQTAINEGKAEGLTSEEREELRRLRREVRCGGLC
jgi:transposase